MLSTFAFIFNLRRYTSASSARRLSSRQGTGTRVIQNHVSTARSTFVRLWVNAHTDAQTRFVIADRPQTIVWAFTLSSRTSIWRFMAIWPSVETLFSITPVSEVVPVCVLTIRCSWRPTILESPDWPRELRLPRPVKTPRLSLFVHKVAISGLPATARQTHGAARARDGAGLKTRGDSRAPIFEARVQNPRVTGVRALLVGAPALGAFPQDSGFGLVQEAGAFRCFATALPHASLG